MKPKNLMAVTLFILLIPPLIGQQIISSGGAQAEMDNGYTLDWTLGESSVSSFSFSNQLLTEGFHQANPSMTKIFTAQKESKVSIQCFPNPFTHRIQVQWDIAFNTDVVCSINNVFGEEIRRQVISGNQIQFDLGKEAAGIYFIHLVDKVNQLNVTQKIIKI